jgi:hypothetical protein
MAPIVIWTLLSGLTTAVGAMLRCCPVAPRRDRGADRVNPSPIAMNVGLTGTVFAC